MRIIDPDWQDWLRARFAARERLEQFMGDPRATQAIVCEFAQCVPGPDATDMDTQDFVSQVLKARVDVAGQDPRVLIRWGVW